jgi:hypothetical protein
MRNFNVLAKEARINLPKILINQTLSQAVQAKLTYEEFDKLLSEYPQELETKAEIGSWPKPPIKS